MKRKMIKSITDGAIITAIYAVFLLASRFIGGLLESYLYFLIPIPLIIYGYKYHFKSSFITSLSICFVGFLCVSNPLNVLFYVIPGVVCGLIYPFILKKKINLLLETIFASSLSLIVNLLTSVLFASLYDYNIVEDTVLFVDEILLIFNEFGFAEFPSTILKSLMISIIPSTLILTAIMEGMVIVIFTRIILIRLKLIEKWEYKKIYNMENIPSFVGIIYIVIFIGMIISINDITTDNNSLFIFYSVLINVGVIFSFFMIYQGMFYLAKWARVFNKKGFYFIAILSIFVFPFFMIFLGVFQNIFHLSQKISIENSKESE